MDITQEEYQLLRILQARPTISYTEIANLFKISPATAKRKILLLRKKGLYSGKYALYYPTALQLFKHIAFLFIDRTKNFEKIENALRKHPYTTHRSRIYSPRLGVYAEFNFPQKEPVLLKQFFDQLKSHKLISDYWLLNSTHKQKLLSLNLNKISFEDFYWNFDWDEFREEMGKLEPKPLPKPAKNVLPEMKLLDLKILRVLTNDADISQRALSRSLGVDRTEVWRRIHFLESKVISSYKSKINRKRFNLTSNKILLLSFANEVELKRVFTAFASENIRPPFRYRIEVLEENKILMYIALPQYHEAQLFYVLNDIAQVESYDIDIVGRHGVRYSLYEPNFDEQHKQWKVSKEYVVDEPLKKSEGD